MRKKTNPTNNLKDLTEVLAIQDFIDYLLENPEQRSRANLLKSRKRAEQIEDKILAKMWESQSHR